MSSGAQPPGQSPLLSCTAAKRDEVVGSMHLPYFPCHAADVSVVVVAEARAPLLRPPVLVPHPGYHQGTLGRRVEVPSGVGTS